MNKLNLYTLNEVLGKSGEEQTFLNTWKSFSNISEAGSLIIARYGHWFALAADPDLTEAELKSTCIGKVALLTSWTKQRARKWNELQGLNPKNTSKSTTRFNDTPETNGDYSSLEHTTNITSVENESAAYREQRESADYDGVSEAVEEFRKRWLWEEI